MKESRAVAPPFLDLRVYKMLANPLRHEIIMRTGERPWSASELAEETGEDLKMVTKALAALGNAGLVELVERGPGPRGGIISRYRAVDRFMLDADEWSELPVTAQANSTVNIIRVLWRGISRALKAGTFHAHPRHVLIRRPMWIDEDGMRELDEIYCAADDAAAEVETRSAERRQRDPAQKPIRVITALLSFPAAPEDSNPRVD